MLNFKEFMNMKKKSLTEDKNDKEEVQDDDDFSELEFYQFAVELGTPHGKNLQDDLEKLIKKYEKYGTVSECTHKRIQKKSKTRR